MLDIYLYGIAGAALFFTASAGLTRRNLKIIDTTFLSVLWPVTLVYSIFRLIGESFK